MLKLVHIHLHCLVLDDMYRFGAGGAPSSLEANTLTGDKLQALVKIVITRLTKTLTRRGVLGEELGYTYLAKFDADGEEACTRRPLHAAAITYRIAFGTRAGQKVLTLRG